MIRELIDTEVEAVVGGGDFNWVNQQNFNYQNAQAFGGNSVSGAGGSALAFNVSGPQTNQSFIG